MFHGRTVPAFLATLVSLPALLASPCAGQSTGPAIFVVNNGSSGSSVTSFRVNADGTLTYASTVVPTAQLNPQTIDVSPNGRWLCVGHGSDAVSPDHLTFIEVHSDATMSIVLQTTTPDSPTCVRWLNDSLVVVTNTSATPNDMLMVYRFNSVTPSMEQVWFSSLSTTTFDIAIDRPHHLLYPRAATSSVWPMTWNDQTGVLTKLTPAPVPTGVFYLGPGVSPDGTKLYFGGGISTANGLSSRWIGGFNVDTSTGALTPMPNSPFLSPPQSGTSGPSPKQVVVSSNGQFAYVSHGTSGDVQGFTINQSTGELTAIPVGAYIDVGGQGNCSKMAVLNNRLYVMRYYSSPNDGVLAFNINGDGTLTRIGLPVYPTQGSLPWDIAVWRGVPCPADIDGTGTVDVNDLLAVITGWGPCANPNNCPGDINGSGTIDVNDLLAVITAWGQCPN